MTPPPDTIDRAYEIMAASYIETLTENAAEAFVDGEVRAARLLKIPMNFHLINSRAVAATKDYRETLERFGGSDVTIVDEAGRVSRQFKPWLNDAIRSDKEEIGKIIDSAVREGTPLKQVEQALDEVFAMREHNARLTAYQETKALYNKGTTDRYAHENVQQGRWKHMDPQTNPRPEHQARDGQVFDLEDPVWQELNLPFCHCYMEPILLGSAGIDNIISQVNNSGEEGTWVTIHGVHVLIKEGETAGDAFKRTTGRDLGSGTSQKGSLTVTNDHKDYDTKLVKAMRKADNRDLGARIASEQERNMGDSIKYGERFQDNAVVRDYTSAGFRDINQNLRDGDIKTNSKKISVLDKAISESPDLPSGTVLYRGVGKEGVEDLMNSKVGDVYKDKAYQSFSTSPFIAESFTIPTETSTAGKQRVIIRAVSAGNTKGLAIGARGEHEVIVGRGSGWKVVSHNAVKTGVNAGRITTHIITVVPA